MALIQCSDCNHKVSGAAVACPSCGRPIAQTVAKSSVRACPDCGGQMTKTEKNILNRTGYECPPCKSRQFSDLMSVKCPTCQSTAVEKIPVGLRLFGLRHHKCRACGHAW